jgi:GTPase Era involved in 16S rRNA processing
MSSDGEFICKVVIMGKTGTGKSTLINYLCGKPVAKVGTGKPVTQAGLYPERVTIDDQEVILYDSWGIEAGKTPEWKKIIKEEVTKRDAQADPKDWFHCVIYCIQAGGGRVENIDSEIIQDFLKDGYHVTIILTKADQASDEELEIMKKSIFKEISGAKTAKKKDRLNIVETCAEKKKLRSGQETEPTGRKEAIAAIFDGWKDTIIDRMPKHVIARVGLKIDDWAEKQKREVEKGTIFGLKVLGLENDNKDIRKLIAENADDQFQKIQKEDLPLILKEAIESCQKASAALKKAFDVQLDNNLFDMVKYENTENFALSVIKAFLEGGLILPAVVNFFRRHSESNIAEQKKELCTLIDNLAQQMKQEIEKKEQHFSNIIEKALS